MDLQHIISIDKDILSGQPVFSGTRVPIETFFDHLEAGIALEEFLKDFPTVSKEQAVQLLEIISKLITSGNITQLYAPLA